MTADYLLMKIGVVRVPDVLHGRFGLLLCRASSELEQCEAAQSCKRAIHLANHRQVLVQDAVGVDGLVAAKGLLDESRKGLG